MMNIFQVIVNENFKLIQPRRKEGFELSHVLSMLKILFHFGVVDTPVNCSVSITIYVDIVIWRNHNLINHCRGLCRLNSRGHGYVISLGFFLFTDEDCTITISRKGKVMPLKRFVESSQFHSLFSKQFIQVGLWSF